MGSQYKNGLEGRTTNLHFHAPVANVSTGDHAQQAARDIINHAPATWQAVGVSFEALREAIVALPDPTMEDAFIALIQSHEAQIRRAA